MHAQIGFELCRLRAAEARERATRAGRLGVTRRRRTRRPLPRPTDD
jgi:hypothetical protein